MAVTAPGDDAVTRDLILRYTVAVALGSVIAAVFVLSVYRSVASIREGIVIAAQTVTVTPVPAPTGPKQQIPEGDGINLIAPSENFSDATWQRDKATVESSSTMPPRGATKAERLVETGDEGMHRILAVISGLTPGGVHTFSVFVKPEQRAAIMLETRDDPLQSYGRANFDLVNKTITFHANKIIDAGVEPIADGWYRCWISLVYNNNRAIVDIGLVRRGDSHYYKGDGQSGLDISGAQFELGRLGRYAPT